MRAHLAKALLFLACVIGMPVRAENSTNKACSSVSPEPFAIGQPFLLADPRSGLTLYVESDGRHMSAITREGKFLWHRNVFDDPKLENMLAPMFLMPQEMEGKPGPSEKEWRQQARSLLSKLSIDRIGLEPDCALPVIDHWHPLFRGHYIRAWSGTMFMWLLDAKSGDLMMEGQN